MAPECRIKGGPCGKTPCAPAVTDCVIMMTDMGLNEGCVYLCSCGVSKLLRAQHCDVKVGLFDCSLLRVIGLRVRVELFSGGVPMMPVSDTPFLLAKGKLAKTVSFLCQEVREIYGVCVWEGHSTAAGMFTINCEVCCVSH